MAEIIRLSPGEAVPELPDEEPWLLVEASAEGRYFGTGYAQKPSGETVFYISLEESDVSLESALAAAERWAAEYQVPRIWLQESADD